MAGAVDLSALKQRAAAASEGSPPGPASGKPNAVEITEANFEAEVLARSNEVPVVVVLWSPRSDASIQLADTLAGLAATDWTTSAIFLDVDLDGYEDLLVSTGHGRDDMDLDHGLQIEAARAAVALKRACG